MEKTTQKQESYAEIYLASFKDKVEGIGDQLLIRKGSKIYFFFRNPKKSYFMYYPCASEESKKSLERLQNYGIKPAEISRKIESALVDCVIEEGERLPGEYSEDLTLAIQDLIRIIRPILESKLKN